MPSNGTTPEEIERAKRWAAMQSPPVTPGELGKIWYWTELPRFVTGDSEDLYDEHFASADAAWSALALALRPVFASVGPVFVDEFKRLAESQVDKGDYTGDGSAIKAFMDGHNSACRWLRDNADREAETLRGLVAELEGRRG